MDLISENELCVFVRNRWGRTDSQILPGSGTIAPKAHRESPFELSAPEWEATRLLLLDVKAMIDEELRPEGYNIAWNVGRVGGQELAHAHLHVVPRFADEPHAGKGVRWWIKQEDNRRPA